MRLRCVAVAVGLALSAPLLPARADAAPVPTPAPELATLDAVIVVATRNEGAIGDAPATVDVIQRAAIERTQAQDLRELFRYEPSVTVTGGFGRFGLGDLRIRGLGGNRVQVQVDGVNVADASSIGSFSDADRDAVDVSILRQVEILCGPASALYGSDALGLTMVARRGAWSWLLHAQSRQGHEAQNSGTNAAADSTRTAANPSDQRQRALLDLIADWAISDTLKLEAAVFNLADRRVWDAADTSGVPASSTVLDRFTRPGRNARITLTAAF